MNDPATCNAALALLDACQRNNSQDHVVYQQGDLSLTCSELLLSCQQIAGLFDTHGYRTESRVAVIVQDTLDFPIIFLGAIYAGVVPIPLNTLLTTEQYRYILQDAGVTGVFVSGDVLPAVQPILSQLPALKDVFVCGGDEGNYKSFSAELAKADTGSVVNAHPDATAFWLYSSGSTGMPKGVRHVHTSMMDTARLYGQQVLGMTSDDVVYSAAKLFFAYGLGNALSFPLSVGATTLLDPARPTPAAVLENMRRYQPTLFFGAPTLFAAMLADEHCTPANGSQRLRLCVSAGEALPADIGERWKERFGVDIIDGVGSTEMLHIFLSNSPTAIHYGRSGKPVPGYDVRLVDETDKEVVDGDVGELLVKGDSAADGYWNQRSKSRQTFVGEWTRTGDKYTRDSDGLYTYAGRTDDMFKVSGQWVSPFEVESALITHPCVVEAAVIPAEDDEGLIKPKAFVVAAANAGDNLSFDVLKAHVQEQVGKWKYPRWIVMVDELPKTATGKIQRYMLREENTNG